MDKHISHKGTMAHQYRREVVVMVTRQSTSWRWYKWRLIALIQTETWRQIESLWVGDGGGGGGGGGGAIHSKDIGKWFFFFNYELVTRIWLNRLSHMTQYYCVGVNNFSNLKMLSSMNITGIGYFGVHILIVPKITPLTIWKKFNS